MVRYKVLPFGQTFPRIGIKHIKHLTPRLYRRMIDFTLFVFTLISVVTSAICTTAIVDKVVFSPLFQERWYEEDFERSIYTHSVFFFIDGVCAIAMLVLSAEAWVPFIIVFIGWIFSAVSYYYHQKILHEMATIGVERTLRRCNIVRSMLWFARFVCVFAFCINLVYRGV